MPTRDELQTRAEQIADAVPYCRSVEGEPGRVFVPSRSRKGPWLVDTDEYSGSGNCMCEDFTCNHEPYLSGKRASEGYSPKRRCFHIIVAIEYLHKLDADRRNGVVPP